MLFYLKGIVQAKGLPEDVSQLPLVFVRLSLLKGLFQKSKVKQVKARKEKRVSQMGKET